MTGLISSGRSREAWQIADFSGDLLTATKRNVFPSDRKNGPVWLVSPSRNFVSGVSVPPFAFTLPSAPSAPRPTRIVPPEPQVPPPPGLASDTTLTPPPRRL